MKTLVLTIIIGAFQTTTYINSKYILKVSAPSPQYLEMVKDEAEESTDLFYHKYSLLDRENNEVYHVNRGKTLSTKKYLQQLSLEGGWRAEGIEEIGKDIYTGISYEGYDCMEIKITRSSPDLFRPMERFISESHKIYCKCSELDAYFTDGDNHATWLGLLPKGQTFKHGEFNWFFNQYRKSKNSLKKEVVTQYVTLPKEEIIDEVFFEQFKKVRLISEEEYFKME